MAILKYRSLFADVLPRRSAKTEKTAKAAAPVAVGKPDTFVSTISASLSSSSSTSSQESTHPPAYSQAVGERSRKAVRVYTKPDADQVLSVTIRLRGDSHGEIFTTTATFHAYDGLQNQIQACLYKNFGKGAIGIATPRGKVITEDWQIYQLAYPGFSSSFCNVVYAREDQQIHTPIILTAAKVLVEVSKKDLGRDRSRTGLSQFLYIDPNESYSTKYIDQTGLNLVLPENKSSQEDLAVRKGYYYKDLRGLPTYDEISPSAFGKACFSASCECCQGWMNAQTGGLIPRPQRPQRPRPQTNSRWKGIELQDYDGLTLAERKHLLRGKR